MCAGWVSFDVCAPPGVLKDLARRPRSEDMSALRRLVGDSPAMRQVLDLVDSVAATPVTVLLVGESGTGKELLARTIAERSQRSGRPFLAVNCSALADSLLESELFGHVRGAFTGAGEARRGLFEEADGGTLFLDEVGDISPAMQVRLLRVLQEGEVKPLGSSQVRRVDVRVVTATNRDLRAAVRAGVYRSDLFYRLDVFRIRIPPLRARPEDIAPLVGHFLERHAGAARQLVEPAALELLVAHPWPGNVRELENVVQRALVLGRGAGITAPVVRAALQVTCPIETLPALAASPTAGGPADLPFLEARSRTLDSFTRTYLEDALRRAGGQIARAARLAGMDKSNFRRLLRRAGLAQP
jgi:two-component system, NtrC family, response regulator HydG